VLRELDEDAPDAAVGTEHHDRLTPVNPRGAVQHLPSGHAVDGDRFSVFGGHPVGNEDRILCPDDRVTGPRAGLGQRRKPSTQQGGVCLRAHRRDGADEVVARGEGELGLREIPAAPHGSLGIGDAGRIDGHQQLPGRGLPHGYPIDDEPVRLDDAGQHDAHRGGRDG